MVSKPAFVGFTGVDDSILIPSMKALSKHYPIEWGILLDGQQSNNPLFMQDEDLRKIQKSGLRLAAHLCGDYAQKVVQGDSLDLNLHGFHRLQINHGRHGSDAEKINNVWRFGAINGFRMVLQCQSEFPTDARVDWLFDCSFGEGVQPAAFPPLTQTTSFCGFSGGFNAEILPTVLVDLSVGESIPFWIDMESGVRVNNRFDLGQCEAVCRAIYD